MSRRTTRVVTGGAEGRQLEKQPHTTAFGEADHEYDIEVVESDSRFELFVEHLGDFGDGAWQEVCDER